MPPKVQSRRLHTACFEAEDTSTTVLDVTSLGTGPTRTRDPSVVAEARAQALLESNAGILRDYEVSAYVQTSHGRTKLVVTTGGTVGAIPLLSPLSARVDYGLVVRPRFGWSSIGEVLWQTGWRIVPEIVPLPNLPTSERRVPPWIISAVVIARMEKLIRTTTRTFETVNEERQRPRGRVDWPQYGRRVARGRLLPVPCSFPDLVHDEPLHRAIAYALRRHQALLRGQRTAGPVVLRLLARCDAALRLLGPVEPQAPSERLRSHWHRRPLQAKAFSEGLEAIDWTLDERGLAGLEELGGLPWRLSMDQFFEAWVETVGECLARLAGLRITCGRKEQTRTLLHWNPGWLSSQQSLLPDVILQGPDIAIVLDAKYKRHLDALTLQEWARAPEQFRESHRQDLLQVLAYSSLLHAPVIKACLLYPCQRSTYDHLVQRRATGAVAQLRAGERSVDLVLAAVPLDQPATTLAERLARLLL